jgi:hypothetical protein
MRDPTTAQMILVQSTFRAEEEGPYTVDVPLPDNVARACLNANRGRATAWGMLNGECLLLRDTRRQSQALIVHTEIKQAPSDETRVL